MDVSGENFSGYTDASAAKAVLSPGPNKLSLKLTVENPRLWWPWDHPELGSARLYRARAVSINRRTKSLTSGSQVFGIKEVKLTEKRARGFFLVCERQALVFARHQRHPHGIHVAAHARVS